MKKLIKRLLVLTISVLMLIPSVGVLAEVDRANDSATLEINGLEGGETVDLYQLMTATYNTEGNNVSYTLDSKLYEADTTVVLKDAVLYTDTDKTAGTIPQGKDVGDVKEEKVTTTVGNLPVDENGKLTSGTVSVDGQDYTVTATAVKIEKSGQESTVDVNGKFPFSTSNPTEKQISAISADIAKNSSNWASNKKTVDGTVTVNATDKKWSVTAYAKALADKDSEKDSSPAIYDATGIYLGKITAAENSDTVYNPVVVSVGYKNENNKMTFSANGINDMNNAKYDSPSVASKKSTPNVEKSVTGGKDESFAPLVVAVGLDGTPIDNTGASLYVGKATIDPDNFYYLKKQDGKTAQEVQNLIKTELEKETPGSIAAYVTNNKEEAYTGTAATQHTGALGTKFTYELQPTLPSYPENAVNKTLWFSDAMSDGLDYVDGSLEVKLDKSHAEVRKTYDSGTKKYVFYVTSYEEVKDVEVGTTNVAGKYEYVEGAWKATDDTAAQSGKTYYTKGTETKLADAVDNNDGFNINFIYDAIPEADRVKGGLIMNYQAVINKDAIKGVEGNPNVVRMIYSNKPDTGKTNDTTDKPSDEGNKEKFDKKVVYTYEIYFKKVDDQGQPLANAEFGLYANEKIEYSDSEKTVLYKKDQLVCTIKTNDAGIGYTTEVVPGKYYIKEIAAPSGYQLNTNKYEVEVKAENATSEVTITSHDSWEYTSDITKAMDYTAPVAPATEGTATQAGWLVNGNFYDIADYPTSAWTYTAPTEPNPDSKKGTLTNSTTGQIIYEVLPAYVSKEDHVQTTSPNVTVKDHSDDDKLNRGWVYVAEVPNTKTPELPSTGGIGTYLFTIGGVAIMATAAFMLIFRKKEEA